MSISNDKVRLLDVYESHQESFFKGYEEDADLPPTELSGDQNGQQSVFSTVDSKNKANFLLTVTTIIKTVIGSGILGLPFTVSRCGYVFSIIVFGVATMIIHFCSKLLLKAKNLSGHSNFSTIMYHVYQNKFSKSLGSFLIFFNNLGICILQIIVFKVSIRKIIRDVLGQDHQALSQFYTREWAIALLIGLCEIPSIIVKKIQRLKFMAFIGVTGILIFVFTFVVHYSIAQNNYIPPEVPFQMNQFPTDWFEAIASIPNLILALAFQMNFFPVFKGMRNASDKKFTQATLVGLLVCSVSYLLVGILGYRIVHTINQDEVEANFLSSLTYDSVDPTIFFIINCCFLLSVFFAFPIMFFGCRNNFIALVQLFLEPSDASSAKKWRENSDAVQQISSYIQSQDKIEKRRKGNRLFYIYTFSIFVVIVGTGIALDDIEVVFNLIGAICSNSISILLPCFFYFMLIIKKNKKKNINFYLSIIIFIIIVPFAIFAVIAQYTKD